VTVGAACFADVDLLFQFVDGRNHHNNELHGIGFALLGALAGAAVFRLVGWTRPLAAGLALGIAYATHPLLDYLNVDTNPPIGLLALWPFSTRYYKFSWPIFMDIGRTLDWHTIRHDTVAALWETILLGPIVVWAWRWRTRGTGAGQWREGSKASP
jgi:membrane-bound metal-dependent hydrolase YbcI (DUF457 family)